MSAPNTNMDKQRRRHRGPLIGIIVVLAFVGIIMAISGQMELSRAQNPGAQTEGQGGSTSVQDASEGSTPSEVDPVTNSDAPAAAPDASQPAATQPGAGQTAPAAPPAN